MKGNQQHWVIRGLLGQMAYCESKWLSVTKQTVERRKIEQKLEKNQRLIILAWMTLSEKHKNVFIPKKCKQMDTAEYF